jgi:small subunit ribosomal protein S1
MDGTQLPDPSSSTERASEREMLELLAETPMATRRPRRGDVVEGPVVYVGREGIIVDIGTKSEAVIPPHEIASFEGDDTPAIQLGDTVVARVLDAEDEEGRTVLSLAQAQAERGWRDLQDTFIEGATVEGRVVEVNRGGLVVAVHGVRGFVPLSQLIGNWHSGDNEDPVETRLEARKNELLTLKILEINRRRNRLILSERAAEHERRLRDRDKLLEDLEEGQLRHGRVSNVCDFGAFVDLGGTDGLVHISELAWSPVGHPSEVVQIGQELDVVVLAVDRDKRKISLSLKRTQAQPWDSVESKYVVGQLVDARVKKLATFGAFVEIEPGVEGLIHISELSDQRIMHPRNVVNEGDLVQAKILRIEPERRRLGLSLRQAQPERESESWQAAAARSYNERTRSQPEEPAEAQPMSYGGPASTLADIMPAGLSWQPENSDTDDGEPDGDGEPEPTENSTSTELERRAAD